MTLPDTPSKPLCSELDPGSFTTIQRRLIMNEDLNPAGRLFGGRLMEWIDEAAALYCMIETKRRRLVTKRISEVIFNEPANLGDALDFMFKVARVGHTSLQIAARVVARPIHENEQARVIVQCELVFVFLSEDGKPEPHGYSALSAGDPLPK